MGFIQKIANAFKAAATGVQNSLESLEIPKVGENAYSAENPDQLLGKVVSEVREDLPINPHGLLDRVHHLVIEDPEGFTVNRHPNDVITENLARKLSSEGVKPPNPAPGAGR